MTADLFAALPQATDHRCLGCGKVHQEARDVTLVDGTTASTYSEAWRLECEARTILNVRGVFQRQNMIATIERKRGKKSADALRVAMTAVFESEKRKRDNA